MRDLKPDSLSLSEMSAAGSWFQAKYSKEWLAKSVIRVVETVLEV